MSKVRRWTGRDGVGVWVENLGLRRGKGDGGNGEHYRLLASRL